MWPSNVEIPIWIDKSLADQPTLDDEFIYWPTKQIMMNEEAQMKVLTVAASAARSCAAIITATLTLLENGNLSPTAKQIAEEAGVGLQVFF